MKILIFVTVLFFVAMTFAGGSVGKDSLPTPTPTMTLAPTPTATTTVGRPTPNINPTLRDCEYYYAWWGRKRAKGTEIDPFPFNKRIGGKVGCGLQTAEVNRVVNGIR